MTETSSPAFEGWAILELMGHRRLAGYLREQEIAGAAFLRLDVPGPHGSDGSDGDPSATQFYAPQAVYWITPTTEETARKVAVLGSVAPVKRWELPAPEKPDDEGDAYDDDAPF
jgi:hypothetical protein